MASNALDKLRGMLGLSTQADEERERADRVRGLMNKGVPIMAAQAAEGVPAARAEREAANAREELKAQPLEAFKEAEPAVEEQAVKAPLPPPSERPAIASLRPAELPQGAIRQTIAGLQKSKGPEDLSVLINKIKSIPGDLTPEEMSPFNKAYEGINQQVAELKKEFKGEKENLAWSEMAELIGHSLIQLAAGAQGLKTGVDMSGVRFRPIDWSRKMDQLQGEIANKQAELMSQRGSIDKQLAAAQRSKAGEQALIRQLVATTYFKDVDQANRLEQMRLKAASAVRGGGGGSGAREAKELKKELEKLEKMQANKLGKLNKAAVMAAQLEDEDSALNDKQREKLKNDISVLLTSKEVGLPLGAVEEAGKKAIDSRSFIEKFYEVDASIPLSNFIKDRIKLIEGSAGSADSGEEDAN